MIDEAATSSESRHRGAVPLEHVRKEILDRQAEIVSSRLRDPPVDPDFTVSVFSHETGYYGIVGTERRPWLDEWLKSDFIEDFCYWNNSDRPDGVDEDEWSRRHSIWKSLFSSVPEKFDCTVRDAFVTNAEIVAAAPAFEVRAAREARRIAELREFERRVNESKPDGEEAGDERFQRLISIAARLAAWANSVEGRAAVQETSVWVHERIRDEIDEDVFMRTIDQKDDTAIVAVLPIA
ncbi:enolase [Rhizobium laguerreae]|uniref:hypothetical protein n=1 Tax=Rhizobium laguerreae TaxID=1076926 RepID=UPI001C927A7F|nr:hypothetical protein [Rhizobium laguerreae]MBY3151299.1 enolase [Rhizobium laguerreae]